MPRTKVNGVEIYYEVHGSGPLFTFVHGLTGNHLSWLHQVPEFSKKYKCLIYDQRCFGMSQFALPDSGDSFGADLYELIQQLGEKDVRLIGQSWGANVALRFAMKHPDMVKSLVIAGSDAGLVDRETALKISGPRLPADPKEPLSINYALDFKERNPLGHYLFGSIYNTNPPRPQDFMTRGRMETPTAEALARLTFPTLFIVGDEDMSSKPALVEAAKAIMPNSTLVKVARAGHSHFLEQHQAFNREVLAFLEKAEAHQAAQETSQRRV